MKHPVPPRRKTKAETQKTRDLIAVRMDYAPLTVGGDSGGFLSISEGAGGAMGIRGLRVCYLRVA